ncbi:hypothetical protein M3591_15180 [Exiguobacterium sp. MER 193]|uniref:hypothetical protein n=1 Tax=Exiguobacterium sp. MER 193 TaxID=2939564 RepID=UPI00203FDE3D|nr:hypothetical protein [Exiguobacterium sp. MER 193]MCM3281829.1 hypothetical protein [Exiguobacterium sp. MER 193]
MRTIDGNVTITGDASGDIDLRNLTITGNLTVNTQDATVNNSATVNGTIDIQDVKDGTWNENGKNNTIVVNDPNGITINLLANSITKALTLNKPATLNVKSGSSLTSMTVNSEDVTVSNEGVIETVQAEQSFELNGTQPTEVKGEGNVTGDNILKLALNETFVKTYELSDTFNFEETKYLAYKLPEVGAQQPSSIEEVKAFVEGKYGVTFNSNAIKVDPVNKTVSIEGSIMNTSDWNKVKQNGDSKIPYRITLLDETGEKLVKIAMFQDGQAAIEKIK